MREALFQILGNRLGSLEGIAVLDLFAGSGALGIEALSRGAAHVTFVDAAKPALAAVRENLRALEIAAARTSLAAMDAVAAAGKLAPPAGTPWRIVFVDPPYRSDLAARAVSALPTTNLTRDAVIVIEHDRRNAPPDTLGSLLRTDQRRYGDTLVSFFEGPS